MCFRPPDTTSGPLICPECNKKIVSPNYRPTSCPFCKADLPPEPAASAPGQIECPKCGTTNPITAKACSGCGATEADFAAAGMGGATPPRPPGAPKMPSAPKAPPSA